MAADAQRGVEREGLGAAHAQRRKPRAPRQARGEEQRVATCHVAPVLHQLNGRAREEGPIHFGAHLRVTEAVASMASEGDAGANERREDARIQRPAGAGAGAAPAFRAPRVKFRVDGPRREAPVEARAHERAAQRARRGGRRACDGAVGAREDRRIDEDSRVLDDSGAQALTEHDHLWM